MYAFTQMNLSFPGAMLDDGWVRSHSRLESSLNCRPNQISIYKRAGDDLRHYPIKICRLLVASPIIGTGIFAGVGFGWAFRAQTSLAIQLMSLSTIASHGDCGQQPGSIMAGSSAVVRIVANKVGHGLVLHTCNSQGLDFQYFLFSLFHFSCRIQAG